MALRQQQKTPRWSPWLQGSGLCVAFSLGLHWAVLQIPMVEEPTTEKLALDAPGSEVPTATIDVVRLPQPAAADPPSKPAPTDESRTRSPATDSEPSATLTDPRPFETEPLQSGALAPDPSEPASSEAPERAEPYPPEPNPSEPDPDPSEPEPTPPGLVHNNKAVELVTDTRDFLTWYLAQNWEGFHPDPPLPARKELPRLQVPYEGTVCLPIPPAPGRLEIIVGSDGQISRAPRLLATTGYDDLDAAALALAAQQNFSEAANPDESSPTVYWLPMEVLYQGPNCPPP